MSDNINKPENIENEKVESAPQNEDKIDEKTDVDEARNQEESDEKGLVNEESDGPRFSIVGVGASAGGLEALEQFFKNMPRDTGMAFVVIQHLSPDYKSLMVELLSKHTKMNIRRADDGLEVEANNIYLIPPKKNMTIFHGKLYLSDQNHSQGLNLPIDIFFRSLAEDLNEWSIGVILSGTGSDGTLGIRAIKGAGGMVMVQDEATAKFDGMPKSAIATGLVDYVLSAENMAEQLVKYSRHPFVSKKDGVEKALFGDEDSLTKILAYIRTKTGTDFTYYKPNTIIRRIERRLSINQLDNLERYLNLLIQSPSEITILYKELLIGVTKFFRDGDGYDFINDKIIPQIFKSKNYKDPIRIWTVGCSTGEEAYSLAILLREYMDVHGEYYDVKIFATDIDKDSIETASAGVYPESIAADISEDRLKNYFIKSNNVFKIKENIRQMVIFATHNIIKDPPFSKIDLLSCRNLLIYFLPVMQKKVLSIFRFSLNESGFLFLGTSESIGDLTYYFSSLSSKWKIYECKKGVKPSIPNEFYIPGMGKKNTEPRERFPIKVPDMDETFEKLNRELYDDYVPPAAVINENYELVHTFNNVNQFLKVPSGKINLNIMNMVKPNLSIALGTSIHKVLKESEEVVYKELTYKEDEKFHCLDLVVRPYADEKTKKKLVLIVFKPCSKTITEPGEKEVEKFDVADSVNQRIEDLEHELLYTKESLQATIEELETSNEELQATNEELIASNEELQSTNEELQSVNEELYTVNSEYQNKIEELTELNNDINNWFNITNIGTIFLDLNLRVRKFTPGVTSAVNLIENDIGRPINHISYNFTYENFFEDVENVLNDLKKRTTEVQTREGRWYLLKIMPYRTIENAVKGIAVTFIDINEQKKVEEQLFREKALLERILENSPIGEVMVDKDGQLTFVNKRAEELFQMKREELVQRTYNSKKWNSLDSKGKSLDDKEKPFEIILRTKKPVYDVYEEIETGSGERLALSINGAPIFDESGEVAGAVFALTKHHK